MLAKQPRLKTLEELLRLRERGCTGGKSAVYALVQGLRPHETRPLYRFEGLAGEFSQHDFGEMRVEFADGRRERVQFFASRLKYSPFACVTPVPNQKTETLVRAAAQHFARFGGVPLLAVFDRPKTVALRSEPRTGKVLKWNPLFAEAMFRLGVGVEVCWPSRANQKGAVENLAGWVKNSFLKVRRFLDRADLQAQLRAWLEETNCRRPSRATGQLPAERLREEAPRLRALRVRPAAPDLRFPVHVGPTAMVTWETNRYSMPPEAIGFSATLHAYADRVVIVAGRHRAEDPRLAAGADAISQLPAHRAAVLACVSGRRGRSYLMRQNLLDLGPAAERVITELVHARPRRWHGDIARLHELLGLYGPDPLRAAFRRAAGLERVSVA